MISRKYWCLRMLLAICSFAISATAQVWQPDAGFAPVLEDVNPPASTFVEAMAYPGERVLTGARYALNGARLNGRLARLNRDGTLDPAFVAPAVSPVAVYPDGRILVQEIVSSPSGTVTSTLRRLLSDGALDPTFTPSTLAPQLGPVRAIALNGSRVLLFREFNSGSSAAAGDAVLLDSNGAVSTIFRAPFSGKISEAVKMSDGRVLIAGPFTDWVARLDAEGNVDATFDAKSAALSGVFGKLYPQPDGSVLLFESPSRLVRLAPNGTRQSTLTPQFVGERLAFGPGQPDGKLPYLSRNLNTSQETLRRLNPDGTPDPSFVVPVISDPANSTFSWAISDSGSFLVGRPLTETRRTGRLALTRVLADGALDPNFNPRFSAEAASTIARQRDGKVLVWGRFDFVNGQRTPGLVRLNSNGSLDTTFSGALGTADQVIDLKIRADGKLLASGQFADGTDRVSMARFNADGSRDPGFRLREPLQANFAIDAAGFIYATQQDSPRGMIRFAPDGALDPSFETSAAYGQAAYIAPLADGAVLIGLQTRSTSLNTRGTLVRLRHDGSLDAGFSSDPNFFPASLAGLVPLPDGRALVCGAATVLQNLNGNFISGIYLRITRITASGSVDYAYFTRAGIQSFLDQTDLASLGGVLFDLLQSPGTPGGASVRIPLRLNGSSATYAVDVAANGKMAIETNLFGDKSTAHFVRTAAPTPSVDPGPFFSGEPSLPTAALALGGSADRTSSQPGGLFPLTYQWLRNGDPVAGATSPTLSLRNAQSTTAGDYTLRLTSTYGSATSSAVRVTVDSSGTVLALTQPPANQTAVVGTSVTFTASAAGVPAPTYQWRLGNTAIPGATNASLVLDNVQSNQAGDYSVVVTQRAASGTSSIQSSSAVLTVSNPVTEFFGGRIFTGFEATEVAMVVRADRTASMLAILPGVAGLFVSESFSVGPSGAGSFNGSGVQYPGNARPVGPAPLRGVFYPYGSVEGSVGNSGGLFIGSRVAPTPVFPLAGYYRGSLVNGQTGTYWAIVSPIGRVLVIARATVDLQFGAVGNLDASGRFTTPFYDGGTMVSAFDAETGKLTVTITGGYFGGMVFAGLRDDVPNLSRLANISTRGRLQNRNDSLVAGFVVAGTSSRQVLIRAIGPTLANLGISGPIEDPMFVLYRGTNAVLSSDNWGFEAGTANTNAVVTRVGAFPLPVGAPEAAVAMTLEPGAYTAEVTAARGTAGVALVEVYDAGTGTLSPSTPKLINLSTRGRVGTGEDVLIAGIVVTGNAPKRLLIRAIGPGLAAFSVPGTLADPQLVLTGPAASGTGTITLATNDDWFIPAVGAAAANATPAEIAAAAASTGAFALPANSRDACLLLTLAPGNYTAQVTGKSATTGIALVEVYEVNN